MTSGSGVDASTVSQEALSTIPRRWRFMLMSSSSGMLSRICVGEGEEIYQLCDFDGTRVLGVLHDLMDVALYGDNLHFKVEAIFVQFLALSYVSCNGNNLIIIIFFQPRDNNRCVQSAGIGENNFFFCHLQFLLKRDKIYL